MLSQIERGQANPTFAVLWGTDAGTLAALAGGSSIENDKGQIEELSATHTPGMRSAGSESCRRLGTRGETEWYDVEISAGGTLESEPHAHGYTEHFTALSERFEVTSGGNSVCLKAEETALSRGCSSLAHQRSDGLVNVIVTGAGPIGMMRAAIAWHVVITELNH